MILGATGMAGHVVYNYLSKMGCYDCIDVVYRKPFTHKSIFLDVTDEKNVYAVLEKEHPDVVVNCVGVLIKGSRENPANAIYINAYFPHSLKKVCDKIDSKLIHVSTDCVFSGKKGNYSAYFQLNEKQVKSGFLMKVSFTKNSYTVYIEDNISLEKINKKK